MWHECIYNCIQDADEIKFLAMHFYLKWKSKMFLNKKLKAPVDGSTSMF